MTNHVWPALAGKQRFTAVGMMSGTSMDGVDAALVTMSASPDMPRLELRHFLSTPYPEALRDSLADLAAGGNVTAEDVARLSTGVAVAFAGGFFDVCRSAAVDARKIDFANFGDTDTTCPTPDAGGGGGT